MNQLLEHAGATLSILLAVLFGMTTVYCLFFFSDIEQDVRWLSFSDVTNISLYVAPLSLFIPAWMLMAFLSVRSFLATRSSLSCESRLVIAYVIVLVHCCFVLLFLYKGLLAPYYTEFGTMPIPNFKGVMGIGLLGGTIILLIIGLSISIGQIRRSPELLLVILLPVLLLPAVAILAARDARQVYECKRPFTASYNIRSQAKNQLLVRSFVK